MNTKIVYTLVSGSNDIYLGQAIISAYSVRLHNPSATIVLVVDKPTEVVVNATSSITSYFDEIVVVDVPLDLNKVQASRFLKTTLRQTVRGDYLYIDTDTVVNGDLSECDSFSADIAAILDRHTMAEQHPTLTNVIKDLRTVGLFVEDLKGKYFNGGVMYVKDSELAKRFYELWHHHWDIARKNGHNIDQPPLAKANKECGYIIQELSGVWNCQMVDNFINYLDNAKVLHYFASHKRSPYKLYNDLILRDVQKEGIISEDLKNVLSHPKSFFQEQHLLVHGDDVAFNHSYVHDMYAYHRWIFNAFDFISRLLVTRSLKKYN